MVYKAWLAVSDALEFCGTGDYFIDTDAIDQAAAAAVDAVLEAMSPPF